VPHRDWYRRQTWTAADREEFFARLRRSRSTFHKAQYLYIQAYCLHEAGLSEEALELIDIQLRDYLDESRQVAMAFSTKGDVLAALGRTDEALEAYRASFEQERSQCPNCYGNAWLRFGETVVIENRQEKFSEALDLFERALRDGYKTIFASQQFVFFGCRALMISARNGSGGEARLLATRAVEAAERAHSGFGRHPTVGLVGVDWRSTKLGRKLQCLLNH
jgi:tetratricopeptide (TPR) repeat protein